MAFVRRILRWKPEITDSVRRFIDDVTSWNSISASVRLVGVHVRCGDVRTRSAVAFGNTIPGRDYFRRAFSYVTGNGVKTGRSGTHHVFVVTSDDVGWTKANLDLERLAEAAMKVAGDPHHVRFRLVYSEGHTAGFDMALLVACDAIILSTGTFGWWSAFLAGNRSSQPTVVYYSRWPRRGSPLDVMLRRRDYWPSQWTAIDGLPYFFV